MRKTTYSCPTMDEQDIRQNAPHPRQLKAFGLVMLGIVGLIALMTAGAHWVVHNMPPFVVSG